MWQRIRAWRPRAVSPVLPEFLRVPWTLWDAVLFIVLWFGAQAAIILLLGAVEPWVPQLGPFLQAARHGDDINANFILTLINAATGFGAVAYFLRKYRVGWRTVGWRKVGVLRAVGYVALALVAFFAVANVVLILVQVLVPGFDVNQKQQNEFIGSAGAHPNLAVMALIVLPPLLEETIFRGFLFPVLAKRTSVIWGAVLSSAVFGLAHGQANVGVYTFVLGLLLCFMYTRTRSILPGVLLHMVNNYLAYSSMLGK